MKSISLKKPSAMDLFGLVQLQPGPNVIDPAVWAKVKDLKLGAMDVTYVQHARAEGILSFEDDSPALVDESGSGASVENAAQPAQPAAPVPESPAIVPAEQPKKRGRPPKGA